MWSVPSDVDWLDEVDGVGGVGVSKIRLSGIRQTSCASRGGQALAWGGAATDTGLRCILSGFAGLQSGAIAGSIVTAIASNMISRHHRDVQV